MKLSELYEGRNYWLGEDKYDSWKVWFLRKEWNDLKLVEYRIVDEDEQREAAYDEVDLYEKRKEEVWNWDTEDGYDRWRDNVDIWDYFSCREFYDYPSDVESKLSDLGYLNNGECPSYENSYFLDEDNAETNLDTIRDEEDYRDTELYDDLRAKFHLNEITFIKTEPIR